MIGGLPWTAWLLLLLATAAPIGLEVLFVVRYRRRRRERESGG